MRFFVVVLIILFMSACGGDNSRNSSNTLNANMEYQFATLRGYGVFNIHGMEYLVISKGFNDQTIAFRNLTLDKLEKEKLELEIKILKYQIVTEGIEN